MVSTVVVWAYSFRLIRITKCFVEINNAVVCVAGPYEIIHCLSLFGTPLRIVGRSFERGQRRLEDVEICGVCTRYDLFVAVDYLFGRDSGRSVSESASRSTPMSLIPSRKITSDTPVWARTSRSNRAIALSPYPASVVSREARDCRRYRRLRPLSGLGDRSDDEPDSSDTRYP